ncbi:MAG: ABC transporter substrate-binding protein [Phycisphaerales bacterium]|nr:ABC transporter substrate-binding protein [Phycisphaerales bacterium]
MDNRFGFKDLILLLLLVVLIVMVGLAMVQYGRQWDLMQESRKSESEQTRELIAIRNLLERGNFNANTGSSTQPSGQSMDRFTEMNSRNPFLAIRQAEKQPDFARGDWLTENFSVKGPKLTPLLSSDVYAAITQSRVVESLVYRDPDTLEYVPLLAKSWQIKDNSENWQAAVKERQDKGMTREQIAADPTLPPAITITFQLRDDVSFSDGQPMTADDVLFTYDWIQNKQVDAPRARTGYTLCRGVKKTGPHEVVFEWNEPYFEAFANSAGLIVLPAHFYGQYTPQQFNETVGLLMGTGPYRLESPTDWRPGKPIILLRNERYWGVRPTFDRVVYLEVEEEAAAMTMFLNGEFDLFGAQPDQYKQMKDDPQVQSRTNFFRYYSMTGGYSYIAWNEKRAGKRTPFADPRIRRAMTLLINRQGLIDSIYQGFGKVATGPFSIGSKQIDPTITPLPHDITQAKALLKECGYEDRNNDGVLEDTSGNPLTFKLVYPNKSPLYDKIALYIKDDLARGGVNLQPDPTEWSIMLKRLDARDFDAISLGWTGGVETDIFQMFHSSQIEGGGDNFISYSNPELDTAIDSARRTVDDSKRMALWQQCHRILNHDQPYTFLANREALVFIDKRIQNVKRSRISLNYVEVDSMPIPWYVPKELQKHR